MSFEQIWGRIKERTDIRTFSELADLVGTTGPYISRKKKENDFPVIWAYEIAQKYKLSTDWIMTGGEKRSSGDLKNHGQRLEITGKIEEWLMEEIRKNPKRKDWFEVEFDKAFEEFKKWKEEKEESAAAAAYSSNRKVA
ncbi:hypothetical protein [Desulfobulbus sp.]|uniref:hypothetical protein n=1 Tax=Desulfobulbus sp. TaxID=895 RepID=UPI0027B91F20|nr:hypothetical protein [Desulfobulbus sp.]